LQHEPYCSCDSMLQLICFHHSFKELKFSSLYYSWKSLLMSLMGDPADENLETKEMDARSLSFSHGQEPYVHKVGIPPRQNLFKEFQSTVKETLFADDPLRSFKDQSKSRKLVLGIEAIFPIIGWGRTYNLTKLRGDLIAGLTIASLCIPQVNLL